MKATFYSAVAALLCGTVSANTPDGDPVKNNDEKLTLEETGPAAASALDNEGSTLLPSTYKTLFQNNQLNVSWGGRIYLDAGFFTTDSNAGGSAYIDDAGGVAGDGAEFRTARLHAQGSIANSVDFKAQFEFEGNDENNYKDVYIAMNLPFGKVHVGHFKEPFSIEQLTSSRFITFMERSLGDVFAPGRNIGIQVSDYLEDTSDLNWAVGIFRDSTDGGPSINDGQYSLTGRMCGTLYNNEDSSSVLHIGGAFSMRSDMGGVTNLTAEPEIHLLADLGGAPMIPSEGATHYNLETAWVDGAMSAQAEFFMASVDGGSGGVDGDYSGYYVMGSYFLTGEKRNYNAKGGKFDRVKVGDNYDGGGGSGALELKVRMSVSDFNDGPTNNRTSNLSMGVNWYLNQNTRIMFDYIHSEYEAGPVDDSLDGIMVRFQVDF